LNNAGEVFHILFLAGFGPVYLGQTLTVAVKNTLWLTAAEVAVNDYFPCRTSGYTASGTGYHAQPAISTLLPVKSYGTSLTFPGDSIGRADIKARRWLTLLADQWQAEDQSILFFSDNTNR
jgi:hypothetical protein